MSESIEEQNRYIIYALREVIALPEKVISIDLSIRADASPIVTVCSIAEPPMIRGEAPIDKWRSLSEDDREVVRAWFKEKHMNG